MFKITNDLIDQGKKNGFCTPNFKEEKAIHRFRLLDGNGEVYFEGVSDDNSCFLPLDYFDEKYGCVDIQYLENGVWESL